MCHIMDMESDVAWQFRKCYSLNYCSIVVLLELSLIIVVEGVCGVEISRNSKYTRSLKAFCLSLGVAPKLQLNRRLTMTQNVRC